MPSTRSPGAKAVTPAPVSVTTAGAFGTHDAVARVHAKRDERVTEVEEIAAARTETRIWPGSRGARVSGAGARRSPSRVPSPAGTEPPGGGVSGIGGQRQGVGGGKPHGGQAGCVDVLAADGELRFPGGQRGGQRARADGVVVRAEVEQHHPVGFLGLGGTHQAPCGGRRGVPHRLTGVDGYGAAGDEDQLGREPVGVLQPPLGDVQGVVHAGAHGSRVRNSRNSRDRDGDRVRSGSVRGAGVDQ